MNSKPPRAAIPLVRVGGVLACLLDAACAIEHRIFDPATPATLADAVWGLRFPRGVAIGLDLAAFSFVAATFWYLTQERHMLRPTWRVRAVLLVQSLVALAISPGLNCILSAQAGFLFSLGMGFGWIGLQSALQVWSAAAYPSLQEWLLPSQIQKMDDGVVWAVAVASILIYHFLSFSFGYLTSNTIRQRFELKRKNRELQATQQIEADAARLAERLTIARDLHDELGHHLTALSLQLQLASKQATGPAKETVEASYLLARTVLSDIRNTVTELRSAEAVRLPEALRLLTQDLVTPEVHLEIDEAMEAVPPLPSHALFRSVQEVITNALRHASAANLWIELRAEGQGYRLVARDDGRGAKGLRLGNGLRGMKERVESLGGWAGFGSAEGGGFRVEILLPRKTGEAV